MGLNFALEAVVLKLKGSNMGLSQQGQMYISGRYFTLQVGMDGRGSRSGSRKIKEKTAQAVQVTAGEPLVVGRGHGEELKSRDTQEGGETRLGS